MKKDIHPGNYRPVIFKDNASGATFLVGSTIKTSETGKWKDGKEYPQASVEVSSASHPFYTGKEKIMDTAGRVEKFKAHAAAAQKAQSAKQVAAVHVKGTKKISRKKKTESVSSKALSQDGK